MLSSITADVFVQYLSWAVFVLIGAQTTAQAVRRPTRVRVHCALMFGGLALAILATVLQRLGLLAPSRPLTAAVGTSLLALPFMLFRLMDDVVGLPGRLHAAVALSFAFWVAVVWNLPPGPQPALTICVLGGMLLVLAYTTVAGVRAAMRARGVTRRRLTAVALGSLLLFCNFGAGRLPFIIPISQADAQSLVYVLGLATGLCYYAGFTPPLWLRRAWQEPELRAFLDQAARMPRLTETAAIVETIEQSAATSLGGTRAFIGLWDEGHGALRFAAAGAPLDVPAASAAPAAAAFRTQRPVFSPQTRYEPAVEREFRLSQSARAVLAAPITAGENRLGVLAVVAARAPVFAEEDMALVQLLADQAAVILESRRLIDEAARVRAREEVTRLKEDFLSAAAHDLKTPLTAILSQAQLIDRRLERTPERPVERASVQRIIRESERLRDMVRDLLDAARAERGLLVGARAPVDVAELAREVAQRHDTQRHPCAVQAEAPAVAVCDALRVTQLLENLVENAVKYSPEGGPVRLAAWRDSGAVHVTVADEGIGIPPEDVPFLFERFHRGSNVDDRRFPGMGLGLYICHAIVTEHGGELEVASRGRGSTFHITLPAEAVGSGGEREGGRAGDGAP